MNTIATSLSHSSPVEERFYVLSSSSSWLQSRLFTMAAERMRFTMGQGPSPVIRFPGLGPYDAQLGYSRIPQFIDRLQVGDYRVQSQARDSQAYLLMTRLGAYPIGTFASDESMTGSRDPELYWLADDAEAAFRDLSRRANVEGPLRQMPYGKVFSIKEPGGRSRYLLELARDRPSRPV